MSEICGMNHSMEVPASLYYLSMEPSQRVQTRRLSFRQLMVWVANFTPRNFGWNLSENDSCASNNKQSVVPRLESPYK